MTNQIEDSIDALVSRCSACGIDRRTFLAQTAALAGVAAFLAGCGAAGDSTAPTFTGSLSVNVSNFPALANVGGIARVDNGGSPVAAVRTGDTQYAAFSLICPHQHATVGINGSGFLCPQHGARFTSDGTWAGGQPTSNLRGAHHPVRCQHGDVDDHVS